jgi:hypothetical protein
MTDNKEHIISWIRLGIISGLLSSIIYPALIFIPLPSVLQVTLVMAWGPLLGISAAGLYYFITLNKKTVSLQIALISQVIAGVLVTLMLIVQMSLQFSKPDNVDVEIWNSINHIQLGIDVAWDLFIFLSTFLFALNMFSHPKLGRVFSISGVLVSVLLIVFNILSFPTPPAEADSIDMGPLVGLWGLAVTITILLNYRWIDAKLAES